jgi:PAS domain S-box-containing protein
MVSMGLLATAVVFAELRKSEHRSVTEVFRRQADQRVNAWIDAIERQLTALDSLYALYANSENVTRDEFSSFVQESVLRCKGVKTVLWVPRVPAGARYELEQQARRDGMERFRIAGSARDSISDADPNACFPIYYAEPVSDNLAVLGFDLGSDPWWRDLLDRAAAELGTRVVAGAHIPGKDSAEGTFVTIRPVYRRQGMILSETDRRASLHGYIIGVVNLDAVANPLVMSPVSEEIDVEFLELGGAEPKRFYRHAAHPPSLRVPHVDGEPGRGVLLWEKPLSLGKQRWLIRYSVSPGFGTGMHSLKSVGSLLVGLCGTVLAVLYVWSRQVRYERVRHLVAERTADLETSRAELKTRNSFLNHILKSLVHPLYVIDAMDFTVRLSNQSIDGSESCMISPTCYESIHGRDRPCAGADHACSVVEIRNTKKPFVFERQGSDREGPHRVFEVHGYPVLDAAGNVSEVVEYHIDITDRKQAEVSLQESEEKFRVLFEASSDAIMTLEPPAWRFSSCNPATLKMFKVGKKAEFLRRGPWEFCPPLQSDGTASVDRAQAVIRKAMEEGGLSFEWDHLRADGEVFPATVLFTRIALGEKVFLQATVRDITEAQRVERQILQQARNQSALNHLLCLSLAELDMEDMLQQAIGYITSTAGFAFESRGAIFLANDGQDMLRMVAQQGIATSLLAICAHVPFGRCLCGRAATSRQTQFVNCVDAQHENTFEGIRPHGHYCAPILWSDTVLGVINVYVKEGHVRRREEEEFLDSAAAVLAGIIKRKQAELRQAELLKEVDSANAELKDFAYVVSHDLKAPLRAIRTLAEWMTTDYGDRLGTEGQEQLRLLVGRAMRMQGLIDGILEYSRIGRVREQLTLVDLNTLVADVIDDLAPPEAFVISVEGPLPTVHGEPTRLRQLFQNLLSNAVKYNDKERGTVRISPNDRQDFWEFSVADNGMGIAPEHFQRVFQIFQTLTPRDKSESTGVGLTVAKKIVECHGGRIWLDSKVGEGTVFYFTLPKGNTEMDNEHDAPTAVAG